MALRVDHKGRGRGEQSGKAVYCLLITLLLLVGLLSVCWACIFTCILSQLFVSCLFICIFTYLLVCLFFVSYVIAAIQSFYFIFFFSRERREGPCSLSQLFILYILKVVSIYLFTNLFIYLFSVLS